MRRVVIAALALFVVAVLAVTFYFNELAAGAVERGGTHALGVETELGSLSLRPLLGRLSLSELEIANPPGFEDEHFLTLGNGRVSVSLRSLLGEPVHVGQI